MNLEIQDLELLLSSLLKTSLAAWVVVGIKILFILFSAKSLY